MSLPYDFLPASTGRNEDLYKSYIPECHFECCMEMLLKVFVSPGFGELELFRAFNGNSFSSQDLHILNALPIDCQSVTPWCNSLSEKPVGRFTL